jgi:hypothetical protein
MEGTFRYISTIENIPTFAHILAKAPTPSRTFWSLEIAGISDQYAISLSEKKMLKRR